MFDMDAMSARIAALSARIEQVEKAKGAGGRSYNRYPPGSKKGGQFAPKAGGNNGGAATGDKPAAGPKPAAAKPAAEKPAGASKKPAATSGKATPAPASAKPASGPEKAPSGHMVVRIPGQKTISTARIVSDLNKNADFKSMTAEQRLATVNAYMSAAKGYKAFDGDISKIAKETGGKAMFPPKDGQKEGTGPLKGVDRALAKIVFDYKGDATRIADLMRATVEVPTVAGAQKAIDYIMKNYEVVEKRSRNFLTENVSPIDGYRDAKFVIRTKSGALAEVQVNVPGLLAAKSKAHKFYEERSAIEREYGLNEGGTAKAVPPKVRDQIKSLNRKMRSIYDPVWLSLLSDVAKSLLKSANSIIQPLLWRDSTRNGRGGISSHAMHPG